MKKTTLCFLTKGDKVLLAMKKRGFGAGKLNGVGGKVEEGEGIKEAAAREAHEEVGVQLSPDALDQKATLEFSFEGKPEWGQECHVFLASDWTNDPKETDEMKPEWHFINSLPFDMMWIDDSHWLPLVLSGKKIDAKFHFDAEGKAMKSFDVTEV